MRVLIILFVLALFFHQSLSCCCSPSGKHHECAKFKRDNCPTRGDRCEYVANLRGDCVEACERFKNLERELLKKQEEEIERQAAEEAAKKNKEL